MEQIKEMNLNKRIIVLSGLECGKHTFIVKVGHKKFYLDIDKNSQSICIDKYNYVSKIRNSFSKYDSKAEMKSLYVEKSYIDKDFMIKFDELSEACKIISRLSGQIIKIK